MYAPLHSQMRLKDEIARELLADGTDDAETATEESRASERPVDVSIGLDSRDPEPSFLTDERDTEVDILTGGADGE
jgi:hypothetical protein